MTSPPNDESASGTDPPTDDRSADSGATTAGPPETTVERSEETIDPPTRAAERPPHQPPAAAAPGAHRERPEPRQETTAERTTGAERVESNWWYCVAAVPIYVGGALVSGVVATVLFMLGVAVDVSGGMGVGTGAVVVAVLLGSVVFAVGGLAVSILFPVGIYLDAKTVAAADTPWEPDPVLYLLVAAASVLLTAFTLSFVVALYYLYRRNRALGVP